MAQKFLQWQQIGKWFEKAPDGTSDILTQNGNMANNSGYNTSSNPFIHDAYNHADDPILMLTAYISANNVSGSPVPEFKKEGNVIYFRNNFTTYVNNPKSNGSGVGYSGVRIGIDQNRSIANPYPYYLTFKARINNPHEVNGSASTSYQPNPTPDSTNEYESAYHVINICNIDKKIINGRYHLCFNSTGTQGLTRNTPVNNTTEINYPLSESILAGDWFTVEVLWSELKETVRINGYSIGSDSQTTSTLGNINTPIIIATAYNWNSHSPHFDIADIEVKRIYERSVVPPTLKIEKQDNGDGTVTLTAQGYTDIVPDGVNN